MPEKVHRELQKQAQRDVKSRCGKDKSGRTRCYESVELRRRAFVYGGMRRTGWKPRRPYTRPGGSGLSSGTGRTG